MSAVRKASYDGVADWFDRRAGGTARPDRTVVESLLGPGGGWCLDVGCGTGQHLDVIGATGRSPVGLELSADQLRLARTRGDRLVRGSAEVLPFRCEAFAAVTAIWVSTDVEDFASVMREAVRVLQPGGRFVYVGVHPCFNGPCVENRDDGARVVHPTYRHAGRHQSSPWWGPDGIRARVGMRHLPLAELLNSIVSTGLRVTEVVEPREDAVPAVLALAADKPG